MFVSDERVLAVGFDAASSRLANLMNGGWLCEVSEMVHQGGVDYMLRVGPLERRSGSRQAASW
jgi:hypothetical protein